ncbi:hypothetical protein IQ241_14185 [Romeria aff. gracilis LEGE 07310]|uniref:Uncharacterized protein n=1 Tax=Vasconcelosia minhoensis LEGE 07310 TaxID=915328 RepID=A0A8J7A985_9CYAN|nr:hypothetical protein [Romeria gracilis]MBE9078430.1 hypothetical protein [Romeria aff. gracilis LEGE 07310]
MPQPYDAQGNPHVAETEFEKRYGNAISDWLERHRHHSLTQLLQSSTVVCLVWLLSIPLICQTSYGRLRTIRPRNGVASA